jgi:hypothetical protein
MAETRKIAAILAADVVGFILESAGIMPNSGPPRTPRFDR